MGADELDAFDNLMLEDRHLFSAWLEFGSNHGWIDRPFCYSHDLPNLTDVETRALWQGTEPCIVVIRLLPFAAWAPPEDPDAGVLAEV